MVSWATGLASRGPIRHRFPHSSQFKREAGVAVSWPLILENSVHLSSSHTAKEPCSGALARIILPASDGAMWYNAAYPPGPIVHAASPSVGRMSMFFSLIAIMLFALMYYLLSCTWNTRSLRSRPAITGICRGDVAALASSEHRQPSIGSRLQAACSCSYTVLLWR